MSFAPPKLYTTQLSVSISAKPPDNFATAVGSVMPVCCGHPVFGVRVMCTLSTRSLARAMEVPTAPVANRTSTVSTATMMAPRRSRRLRAR